MCESLLNWSYARRVVASVVYRNGRRRRRPSTCKSVAPACLGIHGLAGVDYGLWFPLSKKGSGGEQRKPARMASGASGSLQAQRLSRRRACDVSRSQRSQGAGDSLAAGRAIWNT